MPTTAAGIQDCRNFAREVRGPKIEGDLSKSAVLDFIFTHVKGDERPYIRVSAFKVDLIGLLDSGASRTVIGGTGWQKLRTLGVKLTKSDVRLVSLANGDKVGVIGEVTLPLELEGRLKIFDILVIPSLPHELILGADFWKKMVITANLSADSWTMQDVVKEEFACSLQDAAALSTGQKQELESLIEETKERMGKGLGRTNLVVHTIRTDSPPIKQRYYPVSPVLQKSIHVELDKMLAEGIVEPSDSAWASPIVMVKKKDGSYRFCVDFRKLNSVTKKDAYPLPYVSSTLDQLRDAKYLSSLDIKSAFWQVPVEAESKQYTAFTVPGRGLFQFCRMPFGLTNSPATWQRLIDRVLPSRLGENVFVYLDDIIIVTQTFEKHLEVLRGVLDRLHKAGLVVNFEKCEFCRSELKYLGYVVGAHGLQVDPDKVKSVLDIPRPRSVTEVRRFIGMVAWYRRFVPSFSTLVAPITALLKKNKKFNWSQECTEAFESVKERLVSAPILSCPNFELPFSVHTDASGHGIGAVLTQEENGEEKVIAYLSRSLNRCERNYSTTERECLAVLWAVEKLRPYLEGVRFTVVTDHASLVWLHRLKDPTGRLARWAVRLQQFDFDVVHRKGKEHLLPDLLSRSVPVLDPLSTSQTDDKWYNKMIERVESNPSDYPDWRLYQGKLWKHCQVRYPSLAAEMDHWKEVVPKNSRKEAMFRAHDSPTSGHCGIQKCYDRLQREYYWPKMRRDIARYVRNCTTCQAVKPDLQKPAGLMATRRQASRPWQTICVDLIGPLPKSSRGYSFILTVVDQFSKFVLLFPLRSASAKLVCQNIEDNVILLLGAPANIICDNGVQFRSKEFGRLCKEYGIQADFTALYHPQANPSERVNQVVKTMLRAYVSDNHRRWDTQLQKVACAIRTAQHEVTKLSPYFINFGREMSTLGSSTQTAYNGEWDADLHAKALGEMHKEIQARLVKAAQTSKSRYDLRRRTVSYDANDLVWRRNFVLSDAAQHYTAKLAPRYVGPFVINRKVSPWTYELKDETGKTKGIWHSKDLKPYYAEAGGDQQRFSGNLSKGREVLLRHHP